MYDPWRGGRSIEDHIAITFSLFSGVLAFIANYEMILKIIIGERLDLADKLSYFSFFQRVAEARMKHRGAETTVMHANPIR
jgi:hypothetical protein